MEGFLPDGVMEVFGYAALSLLDDVGNRRGAHCAPVALDQEQQMHMVGHDRVFFQMHRRIFIRDLQNSLFNHIPYRREFRAR